MEETNEIRNEVRVCNVKRENIRKEIEDLKSVASQLLVFRLQWKDLDDYYKSVEEKLDKSLRELVSKEIELQSKSFVIEQRVKVVEAAEAVLSDLEIEADEKRKELDLLKNHVKFCLAESKEEEIRLTQLQTRSSELIKTQGELEVKVKQLEHMKTDLERHRGELSVEMKGLNEEIYRKGLDLAVVRDKTEECVKQQKLLEEKLCSQQKVLDARSSELTSKEKKLEELRLELDVTEHTVKSLNDEMEETGKQMVPKAKKLEDIEKLIEESSARYESIKLLIEEHTEELSCKEKKHNEMLEAIGKLSLQMVSEEKRMQHIDNTNEEISRIIQVKQEELCLINEAIRECSGELESKRNDRDHQVRSKATLVEREKELGLKENELDAREEKIDKKYQQLKSLEWNLAKCVAEYEQKAKKLSSFCQQSNTNQRDVDASDEKTLHLLLHGHLKKCSELRLDVLRVLKSSSDPSKLVLDSIQGLNSTHQGMVETNLDPLCVGRSTVCLLECLMSMSPEPNTEVQAEAIKFVTEWKEKTLVKAEDPVEMLGFLHSLAVFSSAYTFNAEKVKNLFDVTFLHKYALSLCKALGVSLSALALVHNKLEHHPPQAPNSNSNDSISQNVQENVASSHLASGDSLTDLYGSASFSPNEVFTGLQYINNPSSYVLSFVNDALMAARKRGELSVSEPIVEILVPLLEELPRVVSSSELLQSEARPVAQLWSFMMGTSTQKSPLEVWGFLRLIVAYGLVDSTKQKETLEFASYVAHFQQAPRLFQSLGLCDAIPNFVEQLVKECKYIPAIRFIFYFNLKNMFTPMEFLKEEIINLRQSAKEKRTIESQAEERKLRDIIELIEEFKLEIDLPSDLIVKFMIPREAHSQNQCPSSVPFQPLQIKPPVHMQASPTFMHSSYIGSNPNIPTNFGVPINPQVPYDQAGSSTQSSHQAGLKRLRVDPQVHRLL